MTSATVAPGITYMLHLTDGKSYFSILVEANYIYTVITCCSNLQKEMWTNLHTYKTVKEK